MAEGLINNKTLIIQGILAEKCGLTPDLYDELTDLLDDIRVLSDAKDSALAILSNENSGLHLQRVKPRTFDPEFDEVECDYYELEQGTEDNNEICHLGLEIECCTHCYMNKALYGA
jgi:hypothetical protein